MNRERLIELRDFLKEHPDRFNYRHWTIDLSNPGASMVNPECLMLDKDRPAECGTVGCVAGWTVAMFEHSDAFDEQEFCIEDRARQLLEITPGQSYALFLNHLDADFRPFGVDEAIRRIDELLETGQITYK